MNQSAALGGVAPTFELRQFAVRSPGAVWRAPLNLRSNAQRIALVGNWEPLFQVLGGRAETAGGTAAILDCTLEAAVSAGILGFAACDPPLPGSFTVTEYLRHAARLSHGSASRAVHDTKRAIDRYGLSGVAKCKLAELALYQRRALGVALAGLTTPKVVCLEAPLRGLDAPSADYVARLCLEAAAHSRLLVSADLPNSPSPERSLLDACDELFVLERGSLVAQGAPNAVFALGARYTLRVKGEKIQAFAQALAGAGVHLAQLSEAGSFNVELPATSN